MSLVCVGSHRRQTVCYVPSVHAFLQLLNSWLPQTAVCQILVLFQCRKAEGRRCPAATLLSFRKWRGCLAANLSVQISPLCRPYQMNPNVKTFYIWIALQGMSDSFQNKSEKEQNKGNEKVYNLHWKVTSKEQKSIGLPSPVLLLSSQLAPQLLHAAPLTAAGLVTTSLISVRLITPVNQSWKAERTRVQSRSVMKYRTLISAKAHWQRRWARTSTVHGY